MRKLDVKNHEPAFGVSIEPFADKARLTIKAMTGESFQVVIARPNAEVLRDGLIEILKQ